MVKSYQKHNDEHQKLIDSKQSSDDNQDDCQIKHSSRLQWAESSWTRYFHMLFWWWISPLLFLGYKRSITEDDLDGLPHKDKSSVLLQRLKLYEWSSTWKIMMKEFWKEYISVGIVGILYLTVRVTQPLLLRQIVINSRNTAESSLPVLVCAVSLSLCVLFQALLDHLLHFYSLRIGVRMRNALISLISMRSLSIKATMWHHIDIGRIINLVANDAYKFEDVFSRFYFILEGPLEIFVTFGLLCWIMHPLPIFIGFLVCFLSVLVSLLSGHYFGRYRSTTLSYSDKRLRAFNEFIHGSQIIKMYNWEKPIEVRITQIRDNEVFSLRHVCYLRTINIIQSSTLIPLLALTIFGSAWLLGYPLDPADSFAAIAFFGLMRSQFMFLMPLITEKLGDLKTSSARIDSFFHLVTTENQHLTSHTSAFDSQHKGRVIMSNASFSWYDNKLCLSSLNITIEPGTLVGITGPVGSGKSSLLAAILGEMNLIDGQLNTHHSSFSYAPQLPWIFSDTLRSNILLNQTYDEERYRNVIYACCLDVDLTLFGSSGDLTMIGERGVNLSGGQKARVSLARALYADADIYMIDDPLAAVDHTVAKQIYERCIGPNGLLKNKTRLLVTHQTQFFHEVDQLIFLSNGCIDEHGCLNENMMPKEETEEKEASELACMINENISSPDTDSIIAEETPTQSSISWSICLRLFATSPLGSFGFGLLIVLNTIVHVFYHGGNYWVSLWVKQSNVDQQHQVIFPYVYFGLIMVTVSADILRTFYYYYLILHGTNNLHNSMLKGLLRTSIQFFERHPSGRILQRASRDQQVMDEMLPVILFGALDSLSMSLGSIVMICFVRPYILLLFIGLLPFFVLLNKFYVRSRIQLKRLESVTRSPIYDLLSSSLNGLPIIRAFRIQNHLTTLFAERIDRNTRAYINMQGALRWFALRLGLASFVNVFLITIVLVIYRKSIDSSLLALCLSYVISIPRSFQATIQLWQDVSFLMVSAERINEYAQLSSEEDLGGHQGLVYTSPTWPKDGTIEFRGYSLSHRSGLDPVLKNINLKIESGKKIGIIGRTGAGKSSLFKGIFRFIHRSNINGQILIDNIHISRITLKHLRSHLSIIPQQSILFSGTLRYNLDPFDTYSDDECWLALEDVQMKKFVRGHIDGLQMLISESGSNLSVGQCQLICIARAMLKKSKILLIDEATANVDSETDAIIQSIFATKFVDRTVLTIAHRLNTVSKCDLLLVLDEGVVVNFDRTMNILEQYL